jgi:hypothetical protein
MPRYRVSINVAVFIDKVFARPCLVWRRFWYGYAYRKVKVLPDKYAKVSPEDFHNISQYIWWAKEGSGKYSAVRLRPGGNCGKVMYMHRQIMLEKQKTEYRKQNNVIACGDSYLNRFLDYARNDKLVVDHINRDSLDNRRANLRLATRSQNNMNRSGRKGASSKYKGVSWYKSRKRWRAMIKVEGKRKSLGYFESEAEAAKVYDEAARKYQGEFAYQNFSEKEVMSGRAKIVKIIRGLFSGNLNRKIASQVKKPG